MARLLHPTQLWRSSSAAEALAIHYAFHAKTGARIIYSHTSAALAHGISLLRVPQELHLAGDPKPGYRHRSLRTHRLPDVARHRVRTDLDLPATSLEQTALACARTLPMLDALVVLDQLAARRVDLARLAHLLRTSPGTHGNQQALLAVSAADARAGSPAETLTRWRLREAGLPEPELQIEVRTSQGRSFLDLGWPQLRVAVEVDGRIKYTDYGPTQEVLIAEREREKRIQNVGWLIRRTAGTSSPAGRGTSSWSWRTACWPSSCAWGCRPWTWTGSDAGWPGCSRSSHRAEPRRAPIRPHRRPRPDTAPRMPPRRTPLFSGA
ncbi:hypothetical protein A5N15_04410, partial [Rothia kristinae]